jgi:two-component system sensor histidine kinase YesM
VKGAAKKRRSLRDDLLAGLFLLAAFAIAGMAVFNYVVFSASVRTTAAANAGQLVDQLAGVVETYISYMEDIARFVGYNADVRAYLAGASGERAKVQDLLASITRARSDIDSIFLLGPGRTDLVSDRREDVFKPAPAAGYAAPAAAAGTAGVAANLSSSHVRSLVAGEYPWVVTLAIPLYAADPGPAPADSRAAPAGALLVDLNYQLIEELCARIRVGQRGYVFIVNAEGDIVYHPHLRLVYSNLKTELVDRIIALKDGQLRAEVDGEGLLYVAKTSAYTGWTIVGVAYDAELYAPVRELEYWYFLFAVVCFLAAGGLGFAIAGRIVRPIETLRGLMRAVEGGKFDLRVEVDCDNEVGDLAADCDIALRKVGELMAEIRTEHELKKREELKALQAQINPHFLYNTLDSVIWLIEGGQGAEAVAMVSTLAKFFRLSLNKGMDVISVREEAEHLRCYLAIQKMRYRERMDYRIDIEPSIAECRAIKLMLQPIAENALYHGLKSKPGPGLIAVAGRRDGGDLVFTVADDGGGMDEATLKAMAEREGERGGVGLRNVSERLRLYFGPEYGLSFASELGRGTTVTVRIPAREEA